MCQGCEELKESIATRESIMINITSFGYTRDCEREYDYMFPEHLKRIVWKYAKELPWNGQKK